MKPSIIPLTSHTPRLRQHVLRSPVARRHANFPPKPSKSQWRCDITNVLWPHFSLQLCKLFPAVLLRYKLATSESRSEKLFPVLHLYYKLATSDSSSEKLFPALHLYYKLATSESSSEKLLPALHLHYELARSESSTYHTIPPMIPLTGDTQRLRQHVSYSPVARRHANALPTKAAQIPMALRYHERTLATLSVHTLEAHISHETANDPAHQPHAAFTPACFALPSGTAPRKHTSHQSRANPNGTATSRTYFGHTSRSSSASSFPHYFFIQTGHF